MSKQSNVRFKNISKLPMSLPEWAIHGWPGVCPSVWFVYLGKLGRNHSSFLGKKSVGDICWVKDGRALHFPSQHWTPPGVSPCILCAFIWASVLRGPEDTVSLGSSIPWPLRGGDWWDILFGTELHIGVPLHMVQLWASEKEASLMMAEWDRWMSADKCP